MEVYRGHYGEGLGNVIAGVARSAIPLMAPMVKRLGSSLIDKGLRTLYHAVGGTPPPAKRPRRSARGPPARRPGSAAARGPGSGSRGTVKKAGTRRASSQKRKPRTKGDIFDSDV